MTWLGSRPRRIASHTLSGTCYRIFRPQDEDSTVRWACNQLLASRGNCRIADLAKGAGLSKREACGARASRLLATGLSIL